MIIIPRIAAAVLTLAAIALPCAAQNYPEKAIRFISPYPPGGTTDLLTRVIGQKLSESFGQPVVVENRAGAGGNVGSEIAARAPGDGYTLLMAPVSPLAINVSLYGKKLPFNPERDFIPIMLVAKSPLVIATHPSVPARTLKELIAIARAHPGKMTYGSSGSGSSNHLTGELFKALAKIDIIHVPYKGGGPASVALISGETDVALLQIPSLLPGYRGGRIRALAISGTARSPAIPEVPYAGEAGLKGLESTSWYAIVAPSKTPRPIVDKLHAALTKIMASPDIRERLTAEGAILENLTPDELQVFIRSEVVKWAQAVKFSGAKVD
ncbi:MAG: tripartite tricarboxylate transporter substrate binding protein [Pseudomonadota bacterium]